MKLLKCRGLILWGHDWNDNIVMVIACRQPYDSGWCIQNLPGNGQYVPLTKCLSDQMPPAPTCSIGSIVARLTWSYPYLYANIPMKAIRHFVLPYNVLPGGIMSRGYLSWTHSPYSWCGGCWLLLLYWCRIECFGFAVIYASCIWLRYSRQ